MNLPRVSFDPDHSQRLPQVSAPEAALPSADPYPRIGRPDDSFGASEGFAEYRKLVLMYLGMALKHRWVIAACCIGGLILGLAVTMAMPRVYLAVTTIQIDPEPARVVNLKDVNPAASVREVARFYQTQFDLLKSRSLAERVVADLDLPAAKGLLQPQSNSPWAKVSRLIFGAPKEDKLSLEERKGIALSIVMSGLKIDPVPNSSLVRIEFGSASPEWSARIANGIAQSYISSTLERRYGATSYAREFLKDRLDDLKVKLEESERALVAYADDKEIIAPSKDKSSLAESDLGALNTALQKATTDRITAQQVWEQASRMKGYEIPQILSDGSVQALRAKRAGLTSDYHRGQETFADALGGEDQIGQPCSAVRIEPKSSLSESPGDPGLPDSIRPRQDAAKQRLLRSGQLPK